MDKESKKIDVMESILDHNDKIAEETNTALNKAGIFTINVMGAPGAGKTSSIISISLSMSGRKGGTDTLSSESFLLFTPIPSFSRIRTISPSGITYPKILSILLILNVTSRLLILTG